MFTFKELYKEGFLEFPHEVVEIEVTKKEKPRAAETWRSFTLSVISSRGRSLLIFQHHLLQMGLLTAGSLAFPCEHRGFLSYFVTFSRNIYTYNITFISNIQHND